MTKTPSLKSQIERNRVSISAMLSGSQTFNRLNSLNWIRHELANEATILFQYPDYMPKSEKSLYLDYTNMSNLGNAWDYILKHQKTPIDNLQIRRVHAILAQGTNIPGGVYRVSSAFIEKLQMHAPNYATLLYRLDDIQFNISNENIPVLTRAFNTHYDLIAAQPFNDFNKRTARLIMNWILIQNDYRPILFNKKTDKDAYMAALLARAQDDCKTYSHYMYECMLRTQREIIKLLSKSKVM